jgi:hypothetical protein
LPFTADPAFTQALVSRGIARPTQNQSFASWPSMLGARLSMPWPLPATDPTIDDLMALSALGVDGRYISNGPRRLSPADDPFADRIKALGITPQWIAGFASVDTPMSRVTAWSRCALGITPDYIAGFQRIGYRNIPVSQLVELKALNITPEFVQTAVGRGSTMPPVNELVEIKMFGSADAPIARSRRS